MVTSSKETNHPLSTGLNCQYGDGALGPPPLSVEECWLYLVYIDLVQATAASGLQCCIKSLKEKYIQGCLKQGRMECNSHLLIMLNYTGYVTIF